MQRFTTEVDPIIARKWVEPMKCATEHNILCEICRKTFPNHAGSILSCIYCNVICHVSCMKEFHKKLNPAKEWICFYCIDFLDESKLTHKKKQDNNLCLAKYTIAQIVVAKYWRRFSCRKFYVKLYNVIIYLQIKFRVNKRKEAFHKQVQGKLRPFHVRITRCSNLNMDLTSKKGLAGRVRKDSADAGSGGSSTWDESEQNYVYVVVTVLDFSKGHLSQTWRWTSSLSPVTMTSGPSHHKPEVQSPGGAPAQEHKTSETHFHADGTHRRTSHTHLHHHQPKHIPVDAAFLLGGVSGYQFVVLSVFQRGCYSRDLLLGQTYVDLSQNMFWKRGGSFNRKLSTQDFAVKDHLGMDMKVDCRAHPQGSVDFELSPVQGLCSGCGMVYSPSAEDLVRIVSLQPRFPGFTVPKPTGGSLDRRKYTVGMTSNGYGGTANLPVKKSWIAIADGRIYMYGHFGDSLKVRINVEHFSFYAVIRNKSVVYILRSPDFPDLEFHTFTKEDELRWKCAFLSTFRSKFATPLRTIVDEGASERSCGDKSISSSSFPAAAFDMRALIRDLALVEVNRYNDKESSSMHFYSPGASGISGTTRSPTAGTSACTTGVADLSTRYAVLASSSISKAGNIKSPVHNSTVPRSTDATATAIISSPKPRHAPGAEDQHLPPAPAAASMRASVSSSSIASTGTSSEGGDGTVNHNIKPPDSRKTPSQSSKLSSTQITVSSSVAAAAASSASTKLAVQGLFDEIDQEISKIQRIKTKYKKEFKEDRLQHQQQHSQRQLQHSLHQQDLSHQIRKTLRHNPSQASGLGMESARSGEGHDGMASARSISSLSSAISSSSQLYNRKKGSTVVPTNSSNYEDSDMPSAPPTLQGIKEAVGEIYQVEEVMLNDTLNTVGANFVARILTSMRQKKMKS